VKCICGVKNVLVEAVFQMFEGNEETGPEVGYVAVL
jgi:hypothetical protein